ncbi:two-component response regulator ORR2-like isoform X2 [Phalaenopsis equestris]|uniref:two-component response regulator ORR2-like isoform X2 n=1 Tax=Phalaenopsis equestris TaxID=78828 RepID=UPI0009E44605|nr:two-component response regulator ORR2-like isoform X2 [Phalaenopsis equestris]
MEKENRKEDEVEVSEGEGKLKVRILVVDDSVLDRRVVERLLSESEEGFEVISVDNGKKAMDVLGLHEVESEPTAINVQSIDIVLTDYCMPGMTGYDLLKAVKGQNFPKPIPVVMPGNRSRGFHPETDSDKGCAEAAKLREAKYFTTLSRFEEKNSGIAGARG